MFNHYRDIMDVYDVAEALCIGKNRFYELLGGRYLKRLPDRQGMENPRAAVEEYILTQTNLRQT